MSILRKSRILCVALIIALIATIIAPIGSFTASAAITNPVSDQADWNKVVDGWYTAKDGGFKFNVGDWSYYGMYGITIVDDPDAFPPNCCCVAVYDADSYEVFENKTKADMEAVLQDTVIEFEKTSVGNAGFTMYYAKTSIYRTYVFQANGYKYFINFIYGTGDMDDLADFAATAMDSIIIADDPVIDGIKSVSHESKDGKIVFTVTTSSGEYNRIKVTKSDDLKGYLAYTNNYTVNADDDYVWTLKINDLSESRNYAFDLRSSETNAYLRDYYYYYVKSAADDYEYTVSNGEATITKYNGDGGDITIPTTLGGYPVTTIGGYYGENDLYYGAFESCDTITSVSMPSITTISDYAFAYCNTLAEIYMPNVTTIDDYAFSGCNSLTSIDMPKVTIIGECAFEVCFSLTSISMPNVRVIKAGAFSYCGDLVTVNIPKNVTSIAGDAFAVCNNLTNITVDSRNEYYSAQDGVLFNKDKTELVAYPSGKSASYIVPDSVTKIGDRAFYSCNTLTSISMPNVTTIGNEAFVWCWVLSDVSMPNVITIGESAFFGCTFLMDVSMPNTTAIDDYAFAACYSLANLSMPNVTTIGKYVFLSCNALVSVSMPNITSIDEGTFNDCSDALTIYGYRHSYAQEYAVANDINFAEIEGYKIKSISHKFENGKVVFTVVTNAGYYNRVKVALADDTKGYLAYTSTYTVNADGDYVWTIKANVPSKSTSYAFDVRSSETNAYFRDYYNYDVEIYGIKSVSHSVEGGKITFTVTTGAGDYNRVKVALADDTKGYIAYTSTHKENSNGDYVWTIKTTAPMETTNYAFDIRSDETNTYFKDYSYYEAEIIPIIKSVTSEIVDDKIVFTVTTPAGDYNRVKLMPADNLKTYLAFTSSYTVKSNGDYVWTIKADAPDGTTNYVFDIRSSTTGKYLKDYFAYRYTSFLNAVDPTDSKNWNKVVDSVFTSDKGGLQMDATGWKTYGLYSISMVPAGYNNVGQTNAICVQVYDPDPVDVFANKTKSNYESVLSTAVDSFTSTTVCGFPAHKVVANGMYYVWVINTPEHKYFIVFMQSEGHADMHEIGKQMMSTVLIYDSAVKEEEEEDEGNTELPTGINSVTHQVKDGQLVFTVTTDGGKFNRVKVTTADDLKNFITFTNDYTVNSKGEYVWTIVVAEPTIATTYAFNARSSETGKYFADFYTYKYTPAGKVDPTDSKNWNKVVDSVFTSDKGGLQMMAEGWKTFNLYSISMVPESYNNSGNTNAICVSVYPKGTDSYDSASVFENKTQADFEKILQAPISIFNKTTITSNGNTYTCYKAVVTDAYYVWVFQTPEAKYFINFMQAPFDNGGYPFAAEAEAMMSTIQIYK